MNIEIETIVKEYFELKEKIKVLEKRRSGLREVLFSIFDSKNIDEIYAADIHVHRVNRPKMSWNEHILKPILAPKGLWEDILAADNEKIQNLIEKGLISESEIIKARETKDVWYTYAERIIKL